MNGRFNTFDRFVENPFRSKLSTALAIAAVVIPGTGLGIAVGEAMVESQNHYNEQQAEAKARCINEGGYFLTHILGPGECITLPDGHDHK
jgi:hypothetical protein